MYNEGVDTLLVEYAYDALGRRIEKADYTVAKSPPLTTRYVYDGQNVIEEINTNGTLERYYINGPRILVGRCRWNRKCLSRQRSVDGFIL